MSSSKWGSICQTKRKSETGATWRPFFLYKKYIFIDKYFLASEMAMILEKKINLFEDLKKCEKSVIIYIKIGNKSIDNKRPPMTLCPYNTL